MSPRLVLIALVAVCLFGLTVPAHADGSTTNCTETSVQSLLRGGGLVTIACDSSITLTNGIQIEQDTVIDGTGHTVTLSGGISTNLLHLIVVEPGVSLTLRNLTLSGGRFAGLTGRAGQPGERAFGAALHSKGGFVTLERCTVANNLVTGGTGGDSIQPGRGGGNGGEAFGAAIYNDGGRLIITNSIFFQNLAVGGSGGTGGDGPDLGNGGNGGDGGRAGTAGGAAIYNTGHGEVAIYDSFFTSNRVTGTVAGSGGAGTGFLGSPGQPGESALVQGGAIFNESGDILIQNTTFADNTAAGPAGHPGNPGNILFEPQRGISGGRAMGAALFNAGTLALTNCTLTENIATGGQGGEGGTGRTEDFGTDGGRGGNGGDATGGGVYTASGGSAVIVNCTFSRNRVIGGEPGLGGIGGGLGDEGDPGSVGGQSGAAILNDRGSIELKNSILGGTTAALNAGGQVQDGGFNLSSDTTPAFTTATSRNSIDPLLGSFNSDNPTAPALGLKTNSPAINAITVLGGNGAPLFDQRKKLRTEPFDIGAFEAGAVNTSISLRAQYRTNEVGLSWSADSSFVLQTTSAVGSGASWTAVTNQPTIGTDNRTLRLPITKTNQFYRLIRP
ncbi:MAG: choice-of-anchor Q domain-containing protein [Verrucomicrobiota bacterium]